MEHGACLNTLEVLDENLILLQAVDGESHCNRNSQWKSLWDSDDHDHNCNNCNLSNSQESVIREKDRICGDDNSKQEQKLSDNTDEGHKHGILGDLFCSFLKLILQESELLLNDEVFWLSISSEESLLTDAADDGLTLACHDLGVRE